MGGTCAIRWLVDTMANALTSDTKPDATTSNRRSETSALVAMDASFLFATFTSLCGAHILTDSIEAQILQLVK